MPPDKANGLATSSCLHESCACLIAMKIIHVVHNDQFKKCVSLHSFGKEKLLGDSKKCISLHFWKERSVHGGVSQHLRKLSLHPNRLLPMTRAGLARLQFNHRAGLIKSLLWLPEGMGNYFFGGNCVLTGNPLDMHSNRSNFGSDFAPWSDKIVRK